MREAGEIRIEELVGEAAEQAAYRLMHQLRHHLNEADYRAHLKAMRAFGYRLFGLFVEDDLVSLAGGYILHSFYNGRYFYLLDLVTDVSRRSQGYGEKLLAYVERWAEEQGCEKLEITSGLAREEAHRFYEEKMGYLKASYIFRRAF
ncbi:GNAT family N-acetyltransferase [Hydrogenibacillus schlegelii]|uniref:Acetyltransferase n=1 Tax=Hydrogenibacillus schlegelii TaxID=1484 RepID=A0A179IMI3_HYDSH|nr:GNAT family N-acetyltransferase [Hydrogenibacillus schlegelii]MBT9281211.1 GNAT family N-acetyltransferase [Hydrogenibacillus schlegelii]OAR03575.1 hypothetical protein SA87_02775 [Hydrogenibacillus schlegelii]PTQ54229.1 MAG: acetyltransferase [Hydrogenibacillus schlegelii]